MQERLTSEERARLWKASVMPLICLALSCAIRSCAHTAAVPFKQAHQDNLVSLLGATTHDRRIAPTIFSLRPA